MKKISNIFTGFFNRKNKDTYGNNKSNEDQLPTTNPEKKDYEEIYVRCLVVGDSEVGKTSLVSRFVDQEYNGKKNTPSDHTKITFRVIDNYKVKFIIVDPECQKYRPLTSSYIRDVNFVIICCSTDKPDFFEDIKLEILQIERYANDVKYYIVKTKDDDNIYTTEPEGLFEFNWREKRDLHYISTSSKNGNGVKELFHNIAKSHIEAQKCSRPYCSNYIE